MNSIVFSYILLIVAFCLFGYYGVGFLLKKWNETQKDKAEKTSSQFEEMFIFLKKEVIVTLYIITPLILGILGFILTRKALVSLIGMAAGVSFPFLLIKFMDKKRRSKFSAQLGDGLMIMSSCLKGGLTLIQSFEVLAEEMEPPIGQEVSLLIREIKVGVSLEEALTRLEKRMPSEEMTLITSAILVARETGGDLTKVFARLIETIRDRTKLKEMVQTLTLQARLQAVIISLLGPVFAVVVLKINPDHFQVMWQNEIGKILLMAAGFLQVIGIILIVIFGKIRI
ncbi:MAG: type II secretion system F family protein [Candidatus Kappaea frigidicola]|nr:type II secretion system F family protein [Candidatus Kappaea frigidicola]